MYYRWQKKSKKLAIILIILLLIVNMQLQEFDIKDLNLDENADFATEILQKCQESDVKIIFLLSDVGAGKTTFSKKLISQFCQINENEISSPTFSIVNIYNAKLAHFDLYRIKKPE